MHKAAYRWVRDRATTDPVDVLDVGGRDINSTSRGLDIRALFPAATWTGMDIAPGPGVDIVADAATWRPHRTWDVVVCTELLEHTPAWRQILHTCRRALDVGGQLIVTTAGPARKPHAAVGGPLWAGEFYRNIDPGHLLVVLADAGFADITVDVARGGRDVRAVAVAA